MAHRPTSLDIILDPSLTTDPDMIKDASHWDGLSDHKLVLMGLDLNYPVILFMSRTIRYFRKAQDYVINAKLETLFSHVCWILTEMIPKFVSQIGISSNTDQPQFNKTLKNLSHWKKRLLRHVIWTNTDDNWLKCTTCANTCNSLLK